MGTANPRTDTRISVTPRPAGGVEPGAGGVNAAAKASMVEPRPLSEAAGGEELFLSPRVMDAGAFARYSEILRTIIAQASAQGRTLEDFSADAEAMIKRSNDASETINKRLQAGIRMLKMIDERAERTDQLLDRVQASLPDSAALGERIGSVIDQRLEATQRTLDEMVARAEARALAAEQRASEAVARGEEAEQRLKRLERAVDERLEALESRLGQSRALVEASGADLHERAQAAQARFEASIDGTLARAHETGEGLARRVEEAVRLTDARLADLDQSLKPVLEASGRAMRALGMDPEQPRFEDSPLARIESLVDRGEAQLASLDRVYRQLEDLQSQAEDVRSGFGSWLVDAVEQMDGLEERKERIVGPMTEAARLIRDLGPDLEQKLELASTQLTHLQIEQQALRQTIQASSSLAGEVTDRMSNHAGQLQALLDGSLHRLSARVEQAGVWLGMLIQRAEGLGAALPGAGAPAQTPERQAAPAIKAEALSAEAPDAEEAPEVMALHAVASAPRLASEEIPMTSFTVPRPAQLPIDALSFDGAERVIEHGRQRPA